MAICEKKKILLYIVSSKSKKSVLKKDHFLPVDRKTLSLKWNCEEKFLENEKEGFLLSAAFCRQRAPLEN